MKFLWPHSLYLLVMIPLIIAAYIWILRRRRKYAVRFSSLALVREVIPPGAKLRRHLPFGLFMLGLAGLTFALGRPTAKVVVPYGNVSVILAVDVSRSMCSTDIPPNRLKAAKAAMLSFIERQEVNTLIGIVAFAGFAEIVQPPTADQEALRQAVNNLNTARRTAVGNGILKSLQALSEVNPNIPPVDESASEGVQPAPLLSGEYAPDIIVVLSDGASNTGPLPLDTARLAAERGVRIFTIGYGTANGASMNCGDQSFERYFSQSNRGFSGGGSWRRGIDEETLKGIAEMTGGEYYTATSASELHKVFEQLPTYLVTRDENMEISVTFAAFGMLMAGLAIALSMAWHPFP
jgi:Ca-activated chloride channel family protein